MPSVSRSKQWFIRITAPWPHISGCLETLEGWIDYEGMMIGYHIGDKRGAPHAHVCLKLKSELQKQSIDARCKKLFEVSGAQYSSKVWDGDRKALSYLYHDPKGHVTNKLGLTEEEISSLMELNGEIQKVVTANKEKASHKVVEYALKHCTPGWTRHQIGVLILTAVANGEFYDPGDFALERYLNEIELKLVKDNKPLLMETINARLARLASFRK